MTIFRSYAVAKAGLRAAVLPESIAEYFPTATCGTGTPVSGCHDYDAALSST